MVELACMIAVLLPIGVAVAYFNPAAERYRATLKQRRYTQALDEGWCTHYARAMAFGEAPPLDRLSCCPRPKKSEDGHQ